MNHLEIQTTEPGEVFSVVGWQAKRVRAGPRSYHNFYEDGCTVGL